MPETLWSQLNDAFWKEERDLTIPQVRVASWLAIGCFSIYFVVDRYVSDNLRELTIVRGIVIGSLLAIITFCHTSRAKRHFKLLSVLSFYVVGFGLVVLTYYTGGGVSRYHEALLLGFFGFPLFIPSRPVSAGIAFGTVTVSYDVLMMATGTTGPRGIWIGNNFLLWASAAVATVGVALAYRHRRKAFATRYALAEVAEAKGELQHANAELRTLDETKTRFFANMTHEFRTPLVALSSTIQMALSDGFKSKETLFGLLHSGKDAIDDMLDNVNNLLLTARAEQGREEMLWRSITIVPWTRRALSVFETIAKQRGITLTFESRLTDGLPLFADTQKLKKIFNNMLGNALKFTESGGKITVRLTHQRAPQDSRHDELCVLQVMDTGKGIPESELSMIFEPFAQASNNQLREVQGTGIGLLLVKSFSELHGGYVDVKSELGVGTTFSVALPMGDAHVDKTRVLDADAESADAFSDGRRPTEARLRNDALLDFSVFEPRKRGAASLLVVEDNPRIAHVLGHVLHPHYNLSFAPDGQEGLERARRLQPDLIMTDVMMPTMNGIELVKALKSDELLRATPVVMLTSKSDTDSRVAGYRAGADEYLAKPFDNEEVLIRVSGLLERKKLEAELVHSEKMVSLGHLVAGIAHEINTPLGITRSSAQFVKEVRRRIKASEIDPQEADTLISDALDAADRGTKRIDDIVKALIGFANPNAETQVVPRDIHQGIQSTLVIAKSGFDINVRVEERYELKEEVVCNLNLLNQVFMNLIRNAFDAMKSEAEPHLVIETKHDGQSALVVFSDNGSGIDPEQHERIFEPFFTTKDVESGMGLGLYLSYKIIEKHGGRLWMEQNANQGTSFFVSLPLRGRNIE